TNDISRLFFHDPPPTQSSTLSLHDALPICFRHRWKHRHRGRAAADDHDALAGVVEVLRPQLRVDDLAGELVDAQVVHPQLWPQRSEEPRLNSSHDQISYAVFCLKKKKNRSC